MLQALFVLVYAVFLWLPLGAVVEDQRAPWYLHLSARVALHGAAYLGVGAVGLYIFQRHKRSQSRGYLTFYRSINTLRRLPIFAMSIVNVILIPLWALTSTSVLDVSMADVALRVTIVAEALFVLPCFVMYARRVRRHNRSSPLPDAQQALHSSFDPGQSANMANGSPVVRRWQADMVRWQQVKITDLQHQVLSLVERNQQLERKQLVLSRSVSEMGSGGGDGGDGGGGGGFHDTYGVTIAAGGGAAAQDFSSMGPGGTGGSESVQRKLEQSIREQQRLSELLKDERRKNRRNEQALIVEREMNLESQRIIDSLHQDEEGFTSTSS
jgi:hypothetical protein